MKLKTILKTAAFATATMFFLGCSESSDSATTTPEIEGEGVIQFAILGEDIEYQNLTYEKNLKSAKIDYAYMLIKNPTLNPSHAAAARHGGGITLEGAWAVDLMAADPANRVPVKLGTMVADAGYYEGEPAITLPKASALDAAVDMGGLAKLKEKNVTFLFGGTFVCDDNVEYKFEIQEPLPTITIDIEEIPNAENAGTPLFVPQNDTLLASFHPHIDHALEVLDLNPIDYSTLTQVDGVIVINDKTNNVVTDKLNNEINVYFDMVAHINQGDHWDVNVNP